MIRPVQANVSAPSFKGFVRLPGHNAVLNTNNIVSIEADKTDYNRTNIYCNGKNEKNYAKSYNIKGNYLVVAKDIAAADKHTFVDLSNDKYYQN